MLPGLGTSLFLIAAGAILRYAVETGVSGVSLPTVGLILMIVGIVGFVVSLLFLLRRPTTVVPGEPRHPLDDPLAGPRYYR